MNASFFYMICFITVLATLSLITGIKPETMISFKWVSLVVLSAFWGFILTAIQQERKQ